MFFYVWLFYIVILSVLSMSWHWFIENSRRLRYIIWLKKRNSLPLFAFLFKDPHSSFILFYNPKLITCTLRRKIAIQLFPCLLSIGIKVSIKLIWIRLEKNKLELKLGLGLRSRNWGAFTCTFLCFNFFFHFLIIKLSPCFQFLSFFQKFIKIN